MPKGSKALAKTGPVRRRTAAPWWLAADDEECAHCGHGYAYETEVRCADCDEPTCMHCAARDRDRVLCPECAPGGGG